MHIGNQIKANQIELNQSTSYDEKPDNASNKGERRMNRGDA